MVSKFKVESDYIREASRLELLIRIPYGLVLAFIGGIWGILAQISMTIHWLYVLVTGRRNQSLWDFAAKFLDFYTRFWLYAGILTDVRPYISQKRSTKKVCIKCGKDLKPEFVACPYCGHKRTQKIQKRRK